MNRSYLIQAFKVTIPVLFGYLAIGIPFGLMLVSAGYPWWLAPIMSVLMYAGAGQYMAVSLFAAGASLSVTALTMLLLNIRHIVYGLSLITPFKAAGRWKPYLVFALTALFAVLLIDQIKKSKDMVPPLIGFAVTLAAVFLIPSDYVLLASLAAGVALLMLVRRPLPSSPATPRKDSTGDKT